MNRTSKFITGCGWLITCLMAFLIFAGKGPDIITVTFQVGKELVQHTFHLGETVVIILSTGGPVVGTIKRRAKRGNVEVHTPDRGTFVVDKRSLRKKKDK